MAARVSRLVFAALDPKAGACGSLQPVTPGSITRSTSSPVRQLRERRLGGHAGNG
ncbi:MAG: hypothetical protein ACRD29_03865 [Acidimicrobiales bacterium]